MMAVTITRPIKPLKIKRIRFSILFHNLNATGAETLSVKKVNYYSDWEMPITSTDIRKQLHV